MANRFDLDMHDYIEQPEGKVVFNKQLFSHIASKYDMANRILSFGRDAVWKKRLVVDLPDLKSPACLDIACGTGDITFRLAAKYPAGKITGIDITEQMLNLARSRLRESSIGCATRIGCVGRLSSCDTQPFDDGRNEQRNRNRFTQPFENIMFEIGDMCKMSFADESFDIVTGGYALRNAPELEQVLLEIRRVMRPGAKAAFLDFSKSPNRFLQTAQDFLLRFWGGFWGVVLHRNPQLYTYIAASLRQLPDSIALKQLIAKLGFTNIRSRKHFFGFTETIIFQKT